MNDDLLDAIGTLDIDAFVNMVYVVLVLTLDFSLRLTCLLSRTTCHCCSTIVGGRDTFSVLKSKVVNVTLTETFLANQSQVDSLDLINFNLKAQIASLSALLPASLTYLRLANDLLNVFPWELAETLPLLQFL